MNITKNQLNKMKSKLIKKFTGRCAYIKDAYLMGMNDLIWEINSKEFTESPTPGDISPQRPSKSFGTKYPPSFAPPTLNNWNSVFTGLNDLKNSITRLRSVKSPEVKIVKILGCKIQV